MLNRVARLARAPLPVAAALLVGAAFVLYWNTLRHPLVFDDDLSRYALDTYAQAAGSFGLPRWLSLASFWWIHAAFGADVLWQRLANVLLHVTTALLLFGFLARLFAALADAQPDDRRLRWLAFFGALWFLVNPVAVYGVAYLMQRSIVLATLFSIVALWCVLEALLRRSARWYAAAGAAYYLALLAKEHAVMVPAVALALAVLVRGPATPARALVRELGGWFLAYAAIGATMIVQRHALIGAAYEPFAADIFTHQGIDPALVYALSVLNQGTLFFRYLLTWLLPWPGWMSIDLRTSFPGELFGWPHTAGFIAWLAYALGAAWLLARGGRLGLAGFGLLYPWLLALTEFAAVRVQEPLVLYRSYLWMSGLPAILPAVVAPLAPRWRPGVLAAACITLAVGAYGRVETFSSAIALWDDAVRKNANFSAPYVDRPYISRGYVHLGAARNAAAAADFERALELNPRSPDAYLGRATLRLRSGRPREALEDLDRAIALDPGYPAAHHKRCIVNAALNRWAEAAADCDKAVELNPLDEEAWNNRGAVYRELRRPADAAASYERALALKPRNGSAHYNYGVLLLDAGRRDAVVLEHFRLACEARIAEGCDLARRLGIPQGGAR